MRSFPNGPDDVSDWTRRRSESSRPAPVPVQLMVEERPPVYELDAGPPITPLDEDDEALAQAIERSQQEVFAPLQRTFTGTDEDELARALSLSMMET